jgi:sec-independent protein translocase protein TatA
MGTLRPWHIIVLVVVLILLFGAKRLPDAARSLGRSLRIIKAETKGLVDDDNDVAEKAEPPYSRQPLHPTEIHNPNQPGQYQQPSGQPGYQQPGQYQQPNGQPYAQQPPQYGQPQQPQQPPYVDPVQRTQDR